MTQIHLNGITLPLSMEFTPIRMERWIRNIGRYYRLTDTSVCPFLENNASHKVYLYVLILDHKSVNDPLTNQPSLTGGSGNHEPFQSSGAHSPCPDQGQPGLPEEHLPLPLSAAAAAAGLLTQVPPPAELQWYVPLVDQLLVGQHQALLQGQER